MRVNLTLPVVQFVGLLLLSAMALFLPAGTLAWIPGWIFFGLFFSFNFAVNVWLYRRNPGLLQERTRLAASDQQGWDKVLFPVLLGFSFAWLIFMSLDGGRFHWSPLSLWLQAAGAAVLLWSFYLIFLTFKENPYLSPVVRLQAEREHMVISTGPYRYVRHPMYAGIIVFVVGTSLLLGSGLGIPAGLIFGLLLARRAVLEERTLRGQLPGYAAYMTRVRYRLVPGLW